MSVEIKVPSPGESVSEVEIASWLVEDGEYVEKDQEIVELDSDKATLAMPAEESGIISITVEEGEAVEVGQVIGTIDTSATKPEGGDQKAETPKEEVPAKKEEAPAAAKADTYASGNAFSCCQKNP